MEIIGPAPPPPTVGVDHLGGGAGQRELHPDPSIPFTIEIFRRSMCQLVIYNPLNPLYHFGLNCLLQRPSSLKPNQTVLKKNVPS